MYICKHLSHVFVSFCSVSSDIPKTKCRWKVVIYLFVHVVVLFSVFDQVVNIFEGVIDLYFYISTITSVKSWMIQKYFTFVLFVLCNCLCMLFFILGGGGGLLNSFKIYRSAFLFHIGTWSKYSCRLQELITSLVLLLNLYASVYTLQG